MNFLLRYTCVAAFLLTVTALIYYFGETVFRPNVPVNVLTKFLYDAGHDIVNPSLCLGDGKQPKVFICVMSAPRHREERMAIRSTWGNVSLRQDVVLAFFVGRSLDAEENLLISEESLRHSDIVRGNSVDTYTNLTLKTISMLEWAYNYCTNVQFVLKTDDDVFVNVNNMLTFVETKWNSVRTIFGQLGQDLGPLWWPSKWYVSSLEYNKPKYPTFAYGSAYLITSDCIPLLYKSSLNTVFFKLEDVFITGIIAEPLEIKRVPSPFFIRSYIPDENFNLVEEAQKRISIHRVEYYEQTPIWNAIIQQKM